MKQIELVKLSLRNFKGVSEFVLDSQGKNVKVFGDNATGKTTLFDGFIWLLFDKDSQNKKDFQLKTVSKAGQELHHLEHEVEATFVADGKSLNLRKVFKEKWTKKRGGQAIPEFTGHTTDYYVNEVPSKKKEYTEAVSQLIDENVFKLLTSPLYFNEQLSWKERRELLLAISGDITDEDVIGSNKALSPLEEILNGRSIEDHRKVIASKRAEINKELDRIPVRIDEVRRSIADTSQLNEQELHDEISFLQHAISQKEEELSRIQNGAEVIEKQQQLRTIETQLIELKNEYAEASYGELNKLRDKISVQKNNIHQFKMDIKQKEHDLNIYSNKIEAEQKEIQDLRDKWNKVNAEAFDEHQTSCVTCGQYLPEEKVQQAIEHFNLQKSEKLEKVTAQGKDKANNIDQMKYQVSALKNQLISLEAEKKQTELVVEQLVQEVEEAKSKTTRFEDTPAYQEKQAQIADINASIQNLKQSTEEAAQKVRQAITGMRQEIQQHEQDKAKFDQVRKSQERISILEAEEKKRASEFEKLENELYLTEEFIRSKVNLLEEKINSKFKYARFKLFDQQINGGLTEICETLYEGVPYSRGLNNAARINVGLDIIATLAEHFNVSAPIFVDNSEAVTKLIDINAQVISLVVSEKDKALRVEKELQLSQEAV
ncbi:hypothetical protein [Priestia aryabhattai]|uniref:hypothetical protein n=1 Tax=Priestia aryabhattai TaxID=412384 RepID=UPI00209A83B7|nr:hypothetical protein [Priestia aryabhattai]